MQNKDRERQWVVKNWEKLLAECGGLWIGVVFINDAEPFCVQCISPKEVSVKMANNPEAKNKYHYIIRVPKKGETPFGY